MRWIYGKSLDDFAGLDDAYGQEVPIQYPPEPETPRRPSGTIVIGGRRVPFSDKPVVQAYGWPPGAVIPGMRVRQEQRKVGAPQGGYPVLESPVSKIPQSWVAQAYAAAVETQARDRAYVESELARRRAVEESSKLPQFQMVAEHPGPYYLKEEISSRERAKEKALLEQGPKALVYDVQALEAEEAKRKAAAEPLKYEVVDVAAVEPEIDYQKMYLEEEKKAKDRLIGMEREIKKTYPLLGNQVSSALTVARNAGYDLPGLLAALKVTKAGYKEPVAVVGIQIPKELMAQYAAAYVSKFLYILLNGAAFEIPPNDPALQRNVNFDELSPEEKKRFKYWRDQTGDLFAELAKLREFRAGVGEKNKIVEIILELLNMGTKTQGLDLPSDKKNKIVDSLIQNLKTAAWPMVQAAWQRDIYGYVGDSYENMKNFAILMNSVLASTIGAANAAAVNKIYEKFGFPPRLSEEIPFKVEGIPSEVSSRWFGERGLVPGYRAPQPAPRPSWDPEHYMEPTAGPKTRVRALR